MKGEKFNPEMLILARESSAMTQSQLADRLSISQANLSKIESGLLGVDSELINRLVDVLGFPESFYFQSTPQHGFASNCLYHRKRQSVSVSDLRRIIAELKIRRLEVSNLLRSVEIETDNRFHRMDIVEFGDSPELIAQLIRRSWSLPPGPIRNLTEAIENAGGIVIHCSFGTNKIDAMSQWAADMPPLIFINGESPGDRLRFSLAHELGHIIMHQIPTEDIEQEADRFAAEFLMPKVDIAPYLNSLTIPKLASLKSYWKVSMAALIERASDLKKLKPHQREYLWKKMSKLGYRMREPVEIPIEEPTIIGDIINSHTKALGYNVAELSRIVHSDELQFRKKYLQEKERKPLLRIIS